MKKRKCLMLSLFIVIIFIILGQVFLSEPIRTKIIMMTVKNNEQILGKLALRAAGSKNILEDKSLTDGIRKIFIYPIAGVGIENGNIVISFFTGITDNPEHKITLYYTDTNELILYNTRFDLSEEDTIIMNPFLNQRDYLKLYRITDHWILADAFLPT